MKRMVAIAMAWGGLSDIHRLWFQPRAILINIFNQTRPGDMVKLIAIYFQPMIGLNIVELFITFSLFPKKRFIDRIFVIILYSAGYKIGCLK